MHESGQSVAVVGVAGGAGATRVSVEFGATLARAGRDVAVVDAAFATQGLASYVDGRIDTDVTAVLADDDPVTNALVDLSVDAPGRLAVCPAHAPFERFARAKTPEAAERLGDVVADLAREFDCVLVDTPPVATNPAVAAVTSADRVALVAPATTRGVDATQRTRDVLADAGVDADALIANRTADDSAVGDADAVLPESDVTEAREAPTCLDPDTAFAPAVARAVEVVTDRSLDLEFPEDGLLDGDVVSAVTDRL